MPPLHLIHVEFKPTKQPSLLLWTSSSKDRHVDTNDQRELPTGLALVPPFLVSTEAQGALQWLPHPGMSQPAPTKQGLGHSLNTVVTFHTGSEPSMDRFRPPRSFRRPSAIREQLMKQTRSHSNTAEYLA